MTSAADLLKRLDHDPGDQGTLAALLELEPDALRDEDASHLLRQTRVSLVRRGAAETATRLLELELALAEGRDERAELWFERGELEAEYLIDDAAASASFSQVLELRPDDALAMEALEIIEARKNAAEALVEKFRLEAEAASNRELASHLYAAAASVHCRINPEDPSIEEDLRKALEAVPQNARASAQLTRLLRAGEKWQELAAHLRTRVTYATGPEQSAVLWADVADALEHFDPDAAADAWREVLKVAPTHGRALATIVGILEASEDYEGLVAAYEAALDAESSHGEAELGALMQLAMLCWKRLGSLDRAEPYFRRLRKLDPANVALLQFYREYYGERGDSQKLLQLLRQAVRQLGDGDEDRRRELAAEIAAIAEHRLDNPEKAIESWKQILAAEPENGEARAALARLYRQTEKWNALLDLMKDDLEALPEGDADGRIRLLEEMVEIYRDSLNLPNMVISTYNSILSIDPDNKEALSSLGTMYEQRGRWNDLIGVLAKRESSERIGEDERVELLHRIASLWIEHFGNYAQAIAPLERLLELRPDDRRATTSLKEIYERRRQWRPLLELLGREAQYLGATERREHFAGMAKLATERLGDSRLAIELWNRVAEIDLDDGTPGYRDGEVIRALTALYEREKRHTALAELYRRQVALLDGDVAASVRLLERLGNLLAERLGVPEEAANTYREILTLDPNNARAMRTLRELYAQAGRFEELESIYGELGQWSELVEALSQIADRVAARDRKVALLERAAAVADERFDSKERVARAYERLLSVDPNNMVGLRALVPIYRELGKWSRLLSTYEAVLAGVERDEERLPLYLEIQELCEKQLQSKAMAFQWTSRAYKIAPLGEGILEELERLAEDCDAWEEAVELLDARASSPESATDEKLRLLRMLGRIASGKLHDTELAQGFQRRVLDLDPDDREASDALEAIAKESADWPNLLRLYQRRAESESDLGRRVDELFRIANLQESQLGDVTAATVTYEEILELEPESRRALRQLIRLRREQGDIEKVVELLTREIELIDDVEAKVDNHMRIGELREGPLGEPLAALESYRAAAALSDGRPEPQDALYRLMCSDMVTDELREELARLLIPSFEQRNDDERLATTLRILRDLADAGEAVVIDKRLVHLYQKLDRIAEAYEASARVLRADAVDGDNRAVFQQLGAELARWDETARNLDEALETLTRDGADVAVRLEVGIAVAELFDIRVGDIERAERAWRRVLEIDPTETRAYESLERICRATDRFRELRDLLLGRVENSSDTDQRRELLLAVAEIDHDLLEDTDAAVAAYSQVLEIDPSSLIAMKALGRIYQSTSQWQALESLLEREQDYVDSDADHVALLARRALLRAERLDDMGGALDLAEEVLARASDNPEVRRLVEGMLTIDEHRVRAALMLEPLYRGEQRWSQLRRALEVRFDAAKTGEDKAELGGQLANLLESHQGDVEGAMAFWREALVALPSSERARESLLRLAAQRGQWPAAAEAFEDVLERGRDADPVRLLTDLGDIYDRQMGATDEAIAAYRRLFDVDRENPDSAIPALSALERLYTRTENYPALADVIAKLTDWSESVEDRRDYLVRLARIREERLNSPNDAIGTWRRLREEDPDHREAALELQRLYEESDRFDELAELLASEVERTEDATARAVLLKRLAKIQAEKLGDVEAAISSLLSVDEEELDRESRYELARLYRDKQRHFELYETLERIAAADDLPSGERSQLLMEMATLLHRQLGREQEALSLYAELLGGPCDRNAVIEAVENLALRPELLEAASGILEPLYRGEHSWDKLASLNERVAEGTQDDHLRLERWLSVAALRGRELGDEAGAFAAYTRALPYGAAAPELGTMIAEIERLARAQRREAELIDSYRSVAPDVLDGALQRHMYMSVADLAWRENTDVATAREYYQLVLDADPADRRALEALESIYMETEAWSDLAEVLARKAEYCADDRKLRDEALRRLAAVYAEKLDRLDDAVLAWEQILEVNPRDAQALDSLEVLYRSAERWRDLVALLERRLSVSRDRREQVDIYLELGELSASQLSDPDAAVESFSKVLEIDHGNVRAQQALEPYLEEAGTRWQAAKALESVYVARQNWPKLVQIYAIKLEAAEDPEERRKLTRDVASLYEDQLEDLEGAFTWYGRLFREEPEDRSIRDQLFRLASVLENWDALALVFQEYLDDEDGEDTIDIALTVAQVYDHRLNAVDDALAAYRRVLAARPEDDSVFERAEAMLLRSERWHDLIALYEEAIAATMAPYRRIELYSKIAQVAEEQLENPTQAIEAHRAILDIDTDHQRSVDELDRLYQLLEQWDELAELLAARIDASTGEALSNSYRLRLAALLETELDDLPRAIDLYEVALGHPGAQTALSSLERLVLREEQRERIAEILEPLYRENDWWQKLVIILDARLEFVEDVATRRDMLREIAHIHASRGGDEGLAIRALARAWHDDIRDEEVFSELLELVGKLGRWSEGIEILEEGISESYDFDQVALVLAHIAEIQESRLGNREAAIAAWNRVVEIRDDDANAMLQLDRLYEVVEKWAEQVKVILRRAELAEDDAVRGVLLHRAARALEEKLEDLPAAIAEYRNILSILENDRASLRALERLYRTTEMWPELAQTLMQELEVSEVLDERRDLRFAAAQVFDDKLSDVYEAISLMTAQVEETADDDEAWAELDRLYTREGMWPELVEVLDRRAELADQQQTAAEIRCRAASVVEEKMLEAENAVERYARVLEMLPAHRAARTALDRLTRSEETLWRAASVLERLYRDEGDFDRVAELYERRLASESADPEARLDMYRSLAAVHETNRSSSADAFDAWARALAENPDRAAIRGELDRLAADRGAWPELASVYEQRLAEAVDAELEFVYADELGRIYDQDLGDLGRAADCYTRALRVAEDEGFALAKLANIYTRAERWHELAETLERQAMVADLESLRCQFLYLLAEVREEKLGQLPDTVDALREILDIEPSHEGAHATLWRLLANDGLRVEIIRILEPLLEDGRNPAKLADLLTHKLSVTSDRLERAGLYSRLAEIAENDLGDPIRALGAAGGWLAEDPHSHDALEQLERLGAVTSRWDEVAARLKGIIDSGDADTMRAELLARLGRTYLEQVGDLERADKVYRDLLKLEPDSLAALGSLERIARERQDPRHLCEVLARIAEVESDLERRLACLDEVGRIREQIGDLPGATDAWQAVLRLDEGNTEAQRHLIDIHRSQGHWREMIEVLEVAAEHANESSREVEIWSRIALTYADHLADLEAASRAWKRVLELNPRTMLALDNLEAILTSVEDWDGVQETLARRLDITEASGERIEVLARMADVAMSKRKNEEDAVDFLRQILDEDPHRQGAVERLVAILERGERWHELIELYEQLAAANQGSEAEVHYLALVADVWDGPLENADAAAEVLEKLLVANPNYVPALTRLARTYQAHEDWERCSEILERALALNPDATAAADLYFRLASVTIARDGDEEAAQGYYRRALSFDANHAATLDAVAAHAMKSEDWETFAAMRRRQLDMATDAAKYVGYAVELATTYSSRLQLPMDAIAVLEAARARAPGDDRLVEPLADAYYAVGRVAEAAPMFEQLAEQAKKARKMKELARYKQRVGGILEGTGDRENALAAYEEAFRVDPTNVATMAGLGRLYVDAQNWDKARRVYRSMVLQEIPPGLGITKAEVYYNLGYIHIQLDEPRKARSMFQRGLELAPDNAALKAGLDSVSE